MSACQEGKGKEATFEKRMNRLFQEVKANWGNFILLSVRVGK